MILEWEVDWWRKTIPSLTIVNSLLPAMMLYDPSLSEREVFEGAGFSELAGEGITQGS